MLIAAEDPALRAQLEFLQDDLALAVDVVPDGQAALGALASRPYGFLLTTLRLPLVSPFELIDHVRNHKLAMSVLVLTEEDELAQGLEAIQRGAYDFVVRPFFREHLRPVLERASRERGLRNEVARLRGQLQEQHTFRKLLGKSPRMQAVFDLIKNAAGTSTTILIEGEHGTGKEDVARAIHEASGATRARPFVTVRCGALRSALTDGEPLSYQWDAPAEAADVSLVPSELAQGGTLFLDEVSALPPDLQAKLLGVLKERRFETIDDARHLPPNPRIIAATAHNLVRLVKRSQFRKDLYYALNVIKIELPPLRARVEDIPLMATHFAASYTQEAEPRLFAPAAMDRLLRYPWPGNVRELQQVVERACVTARDSVIEADDLHFEEARWSAPVRALDLSRPLPQLLREMTETLEKKYLMRALKKTRGNIGRCARLCGLSRRSISAKLAEYHIDKRQFKGQEL